MRARSVPYNNHYFIKDARIIQKEEHFHLGILFDDILPSTNILMPEYANKQELIKNNFRGWNLFWRSRIFLVIEKFGWTRNFFQKWTFFRRRKTILSMKIIFDLQKKFRLLKKNFLIPEKIFDHEKNVRSQKKFGTQTKFWPQEKFLTTRKCMCSRKIGTFGKWLLRTPESFPNFLKFRFQCNFSCPNIF